MEVVKDGGVTAKMAILRTWDKSLGTKWSFPKKCSEEEYAGVE